MIGMNVAELPPIAKRDSTKMQRRGTEGGNPRVGPPSGAIMKYEKPALISVDNNNIANDHQPYTARRSYRSPGSTNSSNLSQGVTASSSSNQHSAEPPTRLLHRSKTWASGTGDSKTPSPNTNSTNKLDTVFEKNHRLSAEVNEDEDDDYFTKTMKLSNGVITDNRLLKPERHKNNDKTTDVPRLSNMRSDRRFSVNSRTHSFTNLSRISDNSSRKKMLSRASSDQNLTAGSQAGSFSSKATNNTGQARSGHRLNTATTGSSVTRQWNHQPVSPGRHHQTNNSRGMRHSKSNPNFQSQLPTERSSPQVTTHSPNTLNGKFQYIWEWLRGVENAERPESPIIVEDEPQQTDTAIHVVYDGD